MSPREVADNYEATSRAVGRELARYTSVAASGPAVLNREGVRAARAKEILAARLNVPTSRDPWSKRRTYFEERKSSLILRRATAIAEGGDPEPYERVLAALESTDPEQFDPEPWNHAVSGAAAIVTGRQKIAGIDTDTRVALARIDMALSPATPEERTARAHNLRVYAGELRREADATKP
jgi:hypothetical protein